MAGKSFVPTDNRFTWETITNRLNRFKPAIALVDHVGPKADEAIHVLAYPSEGINFILAKSQRDGFLQLLREARTWSGRQAFEEGRWQGARHAAKGAALDLLDGVTGGAIPTIHGAASKNSWALDISFMATKGIGFREIWYLELSDQKPRVREARDALDPSMLRLDPRFSVSFEAPNAAMDLSSLHWEVEDPDPKTGRSKCNVHIDQVGVVANLGNGTALTPDIAYHTLVELAFRTGLKGYLPDEVLQAVDFIMPSSHENYALNFGIQVNLINRKDTQLSLRGLCSVSNGGCEWSGAINLRGVHNLLGGK